MPKPTIQRNISHFPIDTNIDDFMMEYYHARYTSSRKEASFAQRSESKVGGRRLQSPSGDDLRFEKEFVGADGWKAESRRRSADVSRSRSSRKEGTHGSRRNKNGRKIHGSAECRRNDGAWSGKKVAGKEQGRRSLDVRTESRRGYGVKEMRPNVYLLRSSQSIVPPSSPFSLAAFPNEFPPTPTSHGLKTDGSKITFDPEKRQGKRSFGSLQTNKAKQRKEVKMEVVYKLEQIEKGNENKIPSGMEGGLMKRLGLEGTIRFSLGNLYRYIRSKDVELRQELLKDLVHKLRSQYFKKQLCDLDLSFNLENWVQHTRKSLMVSVRSNDDADYLRIWKDYFIIKENKDNLEIQEQKQKVLELRLMQNMSQQVLFLLLELKEYSDLLFSYHQSLQNESNFWNEKIAEQREQAKQLQEENERAHLYVEKQGEKEKQFHEEILKLEAELQYVNDMRNHQKKMI